MSDENKKQQQEKKESFPEKQKGLANLKDGKEQSQRGQLDSGKEHQQIKNPPITTKPKNDK